ncbi:MAG: hypothetical protein K1Y02_01885 [Candidatus Hydrogenedentes bacterium]|nr:hypothetical protein [Candidatus Hydrogenedentota bacterium]
MVAPKYRLKRHGRRLCVALALLLSCAFAHADGPAPEAIDAAIDKLVTLDPATLAAKLKEYASQAEAWQAEANTLKQKADEIENHSKELATRVEALKERAKALGMALGEPATTMVAEAAPAAAPSMEMQAQAEAAAPKVNFQEHILPILKQRCVKCHNQDSAKGGLVVDTYASLMEGGSSGAVIAAGQPDSSRLFKLVSRAEEPYMPPSGDPLTAEQLALIKDWIQSGAPQDANSKVAAAEAMGAEKKDVYVAAAIVDGPPPMPEVALQAPAAELAKRVVARAVATSPRAPLAAVAGYKQVLLYNLADYKLLGALPFPEGEIYTIAFSVNGELLLAGGGVEGDSGRVVVWNVRKAERAGVYGEEYDTILAADVSPDHKLLALGGPSKKVKVYSLADGALAYKLEDHTDWITSIKFSPDGELLATADRAGGLLLWQAANGRAVEALRGHTGAINDLGYSADSALLASAGADGTVRLWDTWKYAQTASISAHPGGALSVAFSAANELVTTGIDGLTKRWDTGGKNLATYEKLADWGYQARFGNAGALVLAGTWTGEVSVWDLAGARVATMSTNAS